MPPITVHYEEVNIEASDSQPPLATLQVRLPQDLLKRIDAYRLKLTMRPTRSQTIRFLLENAMGILEEGKDNESKGS
jgi:hypothetical protein